MIYLLLVFIAAICKAAMDNLKDGFDLGEKTWFKRLSRSWVLKYKSNTDLRQKFFGSTTFLVWLTDLWHFSQMIFLMSIFAFLLLPALSLFESVFLFVFFLFAFEIFFTILRKKAKINKTDIFIFSLLLIFIGGLGLNFVFYNEILIWQIFIVSGIVLLVSFFFYSIYKAIKKNK